MADCCRLNEQVVAVQLGYLLGDNEAEQAAQNCWLGLSAQRGLRRHHALADALALRARFERVHGAELPSYVGRGPCTKRRQV